MQKKEIKNKALIALKKAKTSLENNIKMIEDEAYCIDIIQQNLSAVWLIKSANLKLLEAYLSDCNENSKQKNIEDILKIVSIAQSK